MINVFNLYNDSTDETLKVLDNYPIKISLNCVYTHFQFVSFGTCMCSGFTMTFEIYSLILPVMTNFSIYNLNIPLSTWIVLKKYCNYLVDIARKLSVNFKVYISQEVFRTKWKLFVKKANGWKS